MEAGEPDFAMAAGDKQRVTTQAKADIAEALATLEAHLASRTFVACERITLSDVSLFAACTCLERLGVLRLGKASQRWYMTTASHPKVAAAISAAAAESSKTVSSSSRLTAAAAAAGGGAGGAGGNTIGGGKWDRGRLRIKELLAQGESAIGKTVTVKGWVRTSRSAEKGATVFVELTDGSTVRGVQLVLSAATTTGTQDVINCGGVGASLSAVALVVASPAKGQTIELQVTAATVIGPVLGGDNGEVGGKNYPMAKKAHGLEFLREQAHLRPRSKMFSSAMRMRHAMAFATHKFFNERGFVYTHTPLITGADCEGAGEMFACTTLLPEHAKLSEIPVDKAGNVDFSKDFFGKRTCLTVSGQLNVETFACALSDVYTFGPTFRAENSHTARHLAEFWMIEPEICFADLGDDMALAEDYVRYCAAYALENCADDLAYFEDEYPAGEKGLRDRLRNVVESEFARITYTEGVALLQREIAEGKVVFERYPNWGDDLGSEHERYITEKVFKKPTIVINYPKGIKAFYMKLNDDNETVAAMDILVPKIGELIGGSQREDSLSVLETRAAACGVRPQDIWWYADLRRYGTVPHAGFGLGFERLIMFVTGLENIRDVIPFPRVPGHAEF